ncbi:anaerobic C4-dicarboxylate transporter family protein [Turicimonas muris]
MLTVLLLQLVVVVACILIGSRYGGIASGLFGGFGLAILVFLFGLKPGSPPINIVLIICAIISLSSALHAAGGLDYLVGIAAKILRNNPKRITYMAPLVTCFFSLLCGSSYVALAVFPIIVEIAYKEGIRPERPISMGLLGATQALTGSPMSAATAVLVSVLAVYGVTLGQVMLVCIPSVVCALMLAAFVVSHHGVELDKDPEFIRRRDSGELAPLAEVKFEAIKPKAKIAVGVFIAAIVVTVVLGSFPSLLPTWEVGGKVTRLSIPFTISLVMFSFAALMIPLCEIKPGKIIQSSIFSSGMMAVISLFGVAWMCDTFFSNNKGTFITFYQTYFSDSVWLYAVGFFIISFLIASQGAATTIAMPLGVTLGIQAPYLLALFPIANGSWFLPISGNMFAAIAMDRTGTTGIGKYLLNHSFILPGAITCFGSVFFAFILINLFF